MGRVTEGLKSNEMDRSLAGMGSAWKWKWRIMELCVSAGKFKGVHWRALL